MDDLSIIKSGDGSDTILSTNFETTYHSRHGAILESRTIFINAALKFYLDNTSYDENNAVRIFEMGFGSGLNALLTYIFAEEFNLNIYYTTLEAYPINHNLINKINYTEILGFDQIFKKLHQLDWNEIHTVSNKFKFSKINDYLDRVSFDQSYDIIYYDAFGPETQPELWNEAILSKMFKILNHGGVLTTFCAKGSFKRTLKSIGFLVESLPGPPGKREITRAKKV